MTHDGPAAHCAKTDHWRSKWTSTPARAAVAGEDPREPARGERLSHFVRGRGRVVITRAADGRYVIEQAIVAETVGRSYDSISAAASAATGTRVNGYRMFNLGERSRGEARA